MARRTDESGAAYAGSQLQTQLWVNRRTDDLDAAVKLAFPELTEATVSWRSPLADDGYREYSDAAFLGAIDLHSHATDLPVFWPKGGPHWDALAVVGFAAVGRMGVLLAEGKSYPGELRSSGTGAKPGSESRKLIDRALAATREAYNVDETHEVAWSGPLYQSANRLAHLHWLRSRGVWVWLLHLLFVDDAHSPTTDGEWNLVIDEANHELGLGNRHIDGVGHVLLPAGTREELLAADP